ncbi:hypothetical protein WMY93_020473 [Mugilogobius chulae]|uniref:Uncharacterized protein n=1 Tax=Mugilogobius chulae TaxID=88201 RepID=A0AAW0NSF6_9GOBI
MRRFSSEGSLLDLDFLPWKKSNLKSPDDSTNRHSTTYTLHEYADEPDCATTGCFPPLIREPSAKKHLTRERSISSENLDGKKDHKKRDVNTLSVCAINEGCRAYSDGQLAPVANGSTESIEKEGNVSPVSPSNSTSSSNSSKSHHRAKLHAAKLHIKTLFGGQSPHSSHSNLYNPEHKESAAERRSRMLFMRQWSQVGHNRKRKISREELENWAESLTNLLSSHSKSCTYRDVCFWFHWNSL